MIKVIILDFGGVISEVGDFSTNVNELIQDKNLSYKEWRKAMGSSIDKALIGELEEDEFYKRSAKYFGEETWSHKAKWHSMIQKYDIRMVELIKKLHKEGIKLILLSNIIPGNIELFFENYNIENLFSEVIKSCEVKMKKPDLEIFKLTLSKAKARADECLFIDDGERNIEAAKSLGIQSYLYDGDFERFEKYLLNL